MKKNKLAMIIIGILLTSLLIVSCVELEYKEPKKNTTQTEDKEINLKKVETFAEGFKIMEQVDKKYGADFNKEILGGPVVKLENIVPMQKDIDKFLSFMDADAEYVESLRNNTKRTEADIFILFLATRSTMLESEKEFQLGYQYGNAGLVGDGFYCNEKPMIIESIEHFEAAISRAGQAQGYLDLVLSGNDQVTWEFIGIDDNKPEFYNSPLFKMSKQVSENRKIVDKNCPLGTENKFVSFDGDGEATPIALEE